MLLLLGKLLLLRVLLLQQRRAPLSLWREPACKVQNERHKKQKQKKSDIPRRNSAVGTVANGVLLLLLLLVVVRLLQDVSRRVIVDPAAAEAAARHGVVGTEGQPEFENNMEIIYFERNYSLSKWKFLRHVPVHAPVGADLALGCLCLVPDPRPLQQRPPVDPVLLLVLRGPHGGCCPRPAAVLHLDLDLGQRHRGRLARAAPRALRAGPLGQQGGPRLGAGAAAGRMVVLVAGGGGGGGEEGGGGGGGGGRGGRAGGDGGEGVVAAAGAAAAGAGVRGAQAGGG